MSHCIPMSLLSDIPYDHNSNKTYLGVVLVIRSIGYCLVSTQIYHMHGNVGKKVAVLQTVFNKFHWQLLPKFKGPGKDMTISPDRRQTITWTDDGLAIPTQICVPQIRGVNGLIQNRSFFMTFDIYSVRCFNWAPLHCPFQAHNTILGIYNIPVY